MSGPDRLDHRYTNRTLGDIADRIMGEHGRAPANPEVHEPRDPYDREQGKSTELWFYHGQARSVELLTREQAEALLHQLEQHLYGEADRAGYTKLAPNQVLVQLSPTAAKLLRELNQPDTLSFGTPHHVNGKACDCDD